ncbi:hypothetical protein BCY86_05805 [Pajaroellobacter abortibovis]|uniref:Uncharacterized protein n=1 Tax=Pajaroellobacter abortibovis TaxID=1882918 RepID=A0A1L6MXP2_9BACT|nr:hypothetical protein BCY86_05805 [Pajaroellobacter abortibovis]
MTDVQIGKTNVVAAFRLMMITILQWRKKMGMELGTHVAEPLALQVQNAAIRRNLRTEARVDVVK